jgi:hypothetical protein
MSSLKTINAVVEMLVCFMARVLLGAVLSIAINSFIDAIRGSMNSKLNVKVTGSIISREIDISFYFIKDGLLDLLNHPLIRTGTEVETISGRYLLLLLQSRAILYWF